jgi:hypothetical protein
MRIHVLITLAMLAGCDASSEGQGQIRVADTLESFTLPLSPLTTIVFRPGDPAGNRWNVYTTWASAYGALGHVRGLGQVYLEFDAHYAPELHIPAGTWDMSDVIWTDTHRDGLETKVILDDGASIQQPLPGNVLQVVGDSLSIISDRVGPIAPFNGVSLLLSGVKTMFYNTHADAKPAFVVDAPNLRFIGFKDVPLGGVGNGTPLAAPLIDVNGSTFVAVGFSGHVNDNAFTGSGTIQMRMLSPNFNGGLTAAENYQFPAFSGSLVSVIRSRDRVRVEAVVTAATYAAKYGELVRVDSTAGPITITAPKAAPLSGEHFMVKDVGAHAATNAITVISTTGEIIDQGLMNADGQAKTWVSDGSSWLCTARN